MVKKDVLLITVDCLRRDFGGVRNNLLSELIRLSAYFENAYSHSSWTSPAFKSLFSSRYPLSMGGTLDISQFETLPEYLHRSGFETHAILYGPNDFVGKYFNYHRIFAEKRMIWEKRKISVVMGEWKYIRNYSTREEELYFLKDDPQEGNNMISTTPLILDDLRMIANNHMKKLEKERNLVKFASGLFKKAELIHYEKNHFIILRINFISSFSISRNKNSISRYIPIKRTKIPRIAYHEKNEPPAILRR